MKIKRAICAGIIVLTALSANAATAMWTGQMNMVQSVTGQMVWNCEYRYNMSTFWRAFSGNCPPQIEIQ